MIFVSTQFYYYCEQIWLQIIIFVILLLKLESRHNDLLLCFLRQTVTKHVRGLAQLWNIIYKNSTLTVCFCLQFKKRGPSSETSQPIVGAVTKSPGPNHVGVGSFILLLWAPRGIVAILAPNMGPSWWRLSLFFYLTVITRTDNPVYLLFHYNKLASIVRCLIQQTRNANRKVISINSTFHIVWDNNVKLSSSNILITAYQFVENIFQFVVSPQKLIAINCPARPEPAAIIFSTSRWRC